MTGLAFGETGHVFPTLSLKISFRLEFTPIFFKKIIILLIAIGQYRVSIVEFFFIHRDTFYIMW